MNNLIAPKIVVPDLWSDDLSQLDSYQMIVTTLNAFCHQCVVEIRCLGVDGKRNRTDSGYFEDWCKAAEASQRYVEDEKTLGVYFTLNPVTPDLLGRASNRIKPYAEQTTKDINILRRNWLFVDCDVERSAGISSTCEQVQQALQRAIKIAKWMMSQGFCMPVITMSGNGVHLCFPINLPNDAESLTLVEGVLRTLDSIFSYGVVSIDKSVTNAARICRLPGTIARKGDSTQDRPHRMSCLLHMPGKIASQTGGLCDPEALKSVAAMTEESKTVVTVPSGKAKKSPVSANESHKGSMNVPEFLTNFGLEFYKKDSGEFTTYVLSKCPFDETHKAPDSYVYQRSNGVVGFHCSHKSCKDFHWAEFNAKIGVPAKQHSQQTQKVRDTSSFEIKSAWDAVAHPTPMRECVIEGLARRGEVVNVVAATKVGKSWFALLLLFCIATGRDWLGRHVLKGNVLLLDNELHEETIKNRLVSVSRAMNLESSEFRREIRLRRVAWRVG